MYLKRNNINKFWPIPKKGTKYLAFATHDHYGSTPLIIIMREVLKLVKNKKELKKLINEKQVQINHKYVKETNYPLNLFDILTLPGIKKNYKIGLSENKKIVLEEVNNEKADLKIFKIIGKKILPKKKVQLNLMQGKNIILEEKAKVGDSLVLNLKNNKVIKIIPMEKGKEAFVIKGRHMGAKGKILDIIERGGKEIAKITFGDEKINVWVKNIIVVG